MPTTSSLKQRTNWNAIKPAQCGGGKLAPTFFFLIFIFYSLLSLAKAHRVGSSGFSKGKAFWR